MDFLKYISTDKKYSESDPLITRLKLTRGRLAGGFLFFPSGPAGELHFLARIGVHQILPFNTGQNYNLDDCVIPLSLGIDLDEPPYYVDCVTWNDSGSLPHALTVCFFLDSRGEEKYNLKLLKTLIETGRLPPL